MSPQRIRIAHRIPGITILQLCGLLLMTSCGPPPRTYVPTTVPAPTKIPTPLAVTAPTTVSASLTVTVPTTATAASVEPALGFLTNLAGDVEVNPPQASRSRGPGVASALTWASATPFQEMASGYQLRMAANSRATAVCYDGWARTFFGPGVQTFGPQGCQGGVRLPPGSGGWITRWPGTIVRGGGSLVIVSPLRETRSDYGRIPVVLRPRNTSLIDPPPTVSWTEVDGAVRYVFRLGGGPAAHALVAVDVTADMCHADDRLAPQRVCEAPWPWPAAAGVLTADSPYFFTVAAIMANAAAELKSENSVLHILPSQKADEVRTSISDIAALPLDDVTLGLLRAGSYADHDLLDAAIEAYRGVLEQQPSAVVWVAVGDLYQDSGMLRLASLAYQNALGQLDAGPEAPVVRAAAELGVARISKAYNGDHGAAKARFDHSIDLFRSAGRPDAAATAQVERNELDASPK